MALWGCGVVELWGCGGWQPLVTSSREISGCLLVPVAALLVGARIFICLD